MATHTIATTGLLVMTGICLSAGLHHLVVWALQKKLKTHFWFGLMALACAAYDFTAMVMIDVGGHPSHLFWYRVQLESAMVAVPVFVHYALAYAGIKAPALKWGCTALFAVLALLNTFVPDTMLFAADVRAYGVEMPWGEVLYRTVGTPGLLLWVYAVAVVGAVAWVIALLVRHAMQGHKHVAALLVTSSLIFALAVNDTMVDLQLMHSVYLSEYSFVPLIVLMSLALARHMRHEARERESAARRLVQSQAKLQEAQKLETIGRLAGGIAHDFNNLLQVISGHTEVLLGSTLDAETRRKAAHVQAAAQRAADLTRQLLAYARRQVLAPTVLDMNAASAELLAMARRVLGERIELRHEPAPAPAWAAADRTQLEQVLLNLLINARDAMPQGGAITVRIAPEDLDAAFAQANPWARPGEFVRISVTDTGTGMDAETLKHLFEPFFTTKGPGKGTGLGLATAWGIVQQHNGLLHVQSAPGKGTSFHVYLPRQAKPSSQTTRLPAPPTPATARGGVVLLVEDEEMVRELAAEVLADAGYEVLRAPNAETAVQEFARHGERVSLVISDVVMPGMNGPELLQQLRARRAGLPCVFVSGYDFGELKLEGAEAVALLRKPFSPQQLLQELQKLQGDSNRQVAVGATAASSRS